MKAKLALSPEEKERLVRLLDDGEAILDEMTMATLNASSIMKEGYVEEFMKEKGWKLITEDWLARVHRNGSGTSWMHKCAHRGHHSLAKRTDAGRVRCKECGKLLDEAPQMLMELQKLRGTLGGSQG